MKFSKIKLPNTIILIYSFVVLMAILTWVIPAGQYEKTITNGKEVIQNNSFHYIEQVPQSIDDILVAPIKGFIKTADIIIFILIVGGAFSVFNKTKALEAIIMSIAKAYKKSPLLEKSIIPILMILFSLGGATFGMSEETIPFVLIFIPLALMMGYDTITGTAIPFVGAGAGFAGAFMNPFTIGIAQGISGLPPMSGIEYRLFVWAIITTAAIIFVMHYAKKIKKNPHLSSTFELDNTLRKNLHLNELDSFTGITRKQKYVLGAFVSGMIVLVYGVLAKGWFIVEISAVFLATGIVIGMIGKLTQKEFIDSFLEGAKDLFSTALVVAVARGILVIAEDGKIIDTILFNLSSYISNLHPVISSQAMLIIHTIINFFLPSGSGKAALTMPIMAPLSDLVGVSRQTSVLAFQFGDGFSNMFIPTSPITMAVLALAKIPYEKWAKWMLPLQIIFLILGLLLLIPPFFFGYK